MQPKKNLLRTAIIAIAASSLLLSGCTSSGNDGSGDAASDQSLKIGLSADVADLKPARDQGAAAMMLDTLIHRGLLAYDKDGNVVPALAESFEQLDDTSYKFVLRPNLTFQDGSALTSANVKKSLEYLATAESGSKIYSAIKELDSVETPDELTAVVKLKSKNVALPEYLADTTAAILPDQAFEAEGTSWIGAGPFSLEKTDKGIAFSLVKNEQFYDASNVDLTAIDLTIYADGAARSNALIAGDVDLIDFVPWEDFSRVESTPGLVLDSTSGPFMYVHFNVTDGPFADDRVRQAVALTVNRENVASAAFSGQAAIIAGAPIPESSSFFNKELANGWTTDVDKAKSLLAEAGYADGFKATLLTSSQYAFHQDSALSVQADLAKVGITVDLDSPDWATRQEKALAGEYDLAIAGSAGVVNDPSFLSNFVTGPAANNRSFGFDDPELNSLLTDGLGAANESERKEAYDKVQKRILETVPFASLVGRNQAFGYNEKVTGFSNIPGFLTFLSGYTLASTSISSK
ncbi:ABC transporter substrate-binding protein [Arthrobacter sp. Sr24]